jgi:hypothetical protein
MKHFMALALALFILWSNPLAAQITVSELSPVTDIFTAPCLEFNLPKPLALAIARVESGLKPWTLNIEGRSFWFDSKEEALEKAGEAWEAGRSFDLGLMQVNSQWLRRYGITPEAALDPPANIYFGLWILKREINRHGDLRAAIGAYHSPKPERAGHYADLVMAALERRPQTGLRAAKPETNLFSQTARSGKPAPSSPAGVAAATSSPMTVFSKKSVMVSANAMKTAGTAARNSMKANHD